MCIRLKEVLIDAGYSIISRSLPLEISGMGFHCEFEFRLFDRSFNLVEEIP